MYFDVIIFNNNFLTTLLIQAMRFPPKSYSKNLESLEVIINAKQCISCQLFLLYSNVCQLLHVIISSGGTVFRSFSEKNLIYGLQSEHCPSDSFWLWDMLVNELLWVQPVSRTQNTPYPLEMVAQHYTRVIDSEHSSLFTLLTLSQPPSPPPFFQSPQIMNKEGVFLTTCSTQCATCSLNYLEKRMPTVSVTFPYFLLLLLQNTQIAI